MLTIIGTADDALTTWELAQRAGPAILQWTLALGAVAIAVAANWDWLGLWLPFARRHRYIAYLAYLDSGDWRGPDPMTMEQQAHLDEALAACEHAGLIRATKPVILDPVELSTAYRLLKGRHSVRRTSRRMRAQAPPPVCLSGG